MLRCSKRAQARLPPGLGLLGSPWDSSFFYNQDYGPAYKLGEPL